MQDFKHVEWIIIIYTWRVILTINTCCALKKKKPVAITSLNSFLCPALLALTQHASCHTLPSVNHEQDQPSAGGLLWSSRFWSVRHRHRAASSLVLSCTLWTREKKFRGINSSSWFKNSFEMSKQVKAPWHRSRSLKVLRAVFCQTGPCRRHCHWSWQRIADASVPAGVNKW